MMVRNRNKEVKNTVEEKQSMIEEKERGKAEYKFKIFQNACSQLDEGVGGSESFPSFPSTRQVSASIDEKSN